MLIEEHFFVAILLHKKISKFFLSIVKSQSHMKFLSFSRKRKMSGNIFVHNKVFLKKFLLHIVDIVSSDTCDEDREKHDDAGSISRMNTMSLDWFRPYCGVTVIRLVFTVLCYEIRCPR
jgi:hypothetical protein